LVKQTKLSTEDLIYPIFVQEDAADSISVPSMPNVYRLSVDKTINEVTEVSKLGIPAVVLFGIPSKKDEKGSSAYAKDGVIQKTVKRIKDELGENIVVITDVCLCEYTDHGHCGILNNGDLNNDASLEVLEKIAVSHAESGADIVAPSAMIDGQVKSIREALDKEGYNNIAILAYSAKFSSAFYSPFRDAADSIPQSGDRRSYQMDYSNSDEAIREIELDIAEGADIVMVKPALSYLDIINRASSLFKTPIAAYNVSGEFSLIKAAAQNKWVDEKNIVLEIMTSIKRAGAGLIITYHAKDIARWINYKEI
jgi:porphobilinogen synthase